MVMFYIWLLSYVDTRPFSTIDDGAGGTSFTCAGDYPEMNQGPPFARDRGLLSAADIPPDWKEADKKVVRFFADLDESVSTFDPGSVVYHRDQGLKDLLDAMPRSRCPGNSRHQHRNHSSRKRLLRGRR